MEGASVESFNVYRDDRPYLRGNCKTIYRGPEEEMTSTIVLRAYKYRLYPRSSQISFLTHHFGAARFVYNHFLDLRDKSFKAGVPLDGFACKRMLPSLKIAHPWLVKINSQSLQQSVLNLDLACKRFFKKLGKYPKFKKKRGKQSFTIPQHFSIKDGYLYIPKLKTGLPVKFHRPIGGTIKSLTISREPSGKYFVSFAVEQEIELPAVSQNGNVQGYDLGLISFTTSSAGEKVEVPKFLRKSLDKIKHLNREVSRKQKGSKNRAKARVKLARAHEKVKNQRSNFLHQQSRKAVDDNQVLCLEDLNVKGMQMCGTLGLSISDAGLGEFIRQVEYKALWAGKKVVRIGRFYPSSKTCSTCWSVNNEMELADRTWTCEICGTVHDRDINAAKVIKIVGQDLPDVKPVERRTTVFSMKEMGRARAARIQREGKPTSVKQEAKASRGSVTIPVPLRCPGF
jgi:putative transposase